MVTDGGVHEVPVERLAEEFGAESYLARFRHIAAAGSTPRLAVLRLACDCMGEAAEIVSPDGNITSDVHALRNERGVLLREVLRLRAENDMLRKSTDAAVDGVRAMLPEALRVARDHVVRDEAPRGRTWVAADVPEGATVRVQDGRRWRAMVRVGGRA